VAIAVHIEAALRSHFTSQIALASQLFAASAGLYLLTPLAANAQSQAAPAIQKMSKADRELTQKIRKAASLPFLNEPVVITSAHHS
jgi:hypothetical protein